jgi:ferric-dicitrate binding protein FerR (iron transport regulator)
LAHWYGVSVRLGDSALAHRRYTASLKTETLPQLLDLMAWSLELRVAHVGDTVVLYNKFRAYPRSLR